MIANCTKCETSTAPSAQFQNKEHGQGKRVHNPLPKKDKQPQQHRCTVCGTVK